MKTEQVLIISKIERGSSLIVNGKEIDFPDAISISELLRGLNLNCDKIVVEVNMEFISREQYSSVLLNQEDVVEIISFVGGG